MTTMIRSTIKICPIMSLIFAVAVLIAGGRMIYGLTHDLDLMAALGAGTPWASAWAAIFGASLHLYNRRSTIEQGVQNG